MTDREQLEQLARLTRDHISLLVQQKATTAEMLRACIARLKSPDSRKRKEAIDALTQLADLLEEKNGDV